MHDEKRYSSPIEKIYLVFNIQLVWLLYFTTLFLFCKHLYCKKFEFYILKQLGKFAFLREEQALSPITHKIFPPPLAIPCVLAYNRHDIYIFSKVILLCGNFYLTFLTPFSLLDMSAQLARLHPTNARKTATISFSKRVVASLSRCSLQFSVRGRECYLTFSA